MSLFENFTKKKKPIEIPTAEATLTPAVDDKVASIESATEEKSEGYYFQTPIELAIYGKLYGGKDKIVYWLEGNNYIETYNKGFQLFEQGRFQDALAAYRACLILNPIGISARFEICECYIRMQQYADAKRTLLEMKDFLIEKENIAQFYRRIGFIAIEERNYECAIAAYAYSLDFQNHPSVKNEMDYIRHISRMSSIKVASITRNAGAVLERNGLPVLTEIMLN